MLAPGQQAKGWLSQGSGGGVWRDQAGRQACLPLLLPRPLETGLTVLSKSLDKETWHWMSPARPCLWYMESRMQNG
ncbi:hypothetical protein Y1Q_0007090 [Alligator mississippiensis]|uniref:Uncharacterized protein n=1 Tax=Alligator mississippiensis TaxID=8496 RepID=A0A151N5U7_ALLMI|nr:hypothetical protein Y1Q_0007090 [Alligator mississippiensis]